MMLSMFDDDQAADEAGGGEALLAPLAPAAPIRPLDELARRGGAER